MSAATSVRSVWRQQFIVTAFVLLGGLFGQAHAQKIIQVCDDSGAAARAPFANTQCSAFGPAAPADGEVVLTNPTGLNYNWSATQWAVEDTLSASAYIWADDAGWVLKSQVAFPGGQSSPPPPQGNGTDIRINAGGGQYTDSAGNVWSADTDFNSSDTTNWGAVAITGTSDPTLYQDERYGPNLQYTFALANGTYQVNLHFAENYVNSTFPNGGIGYRLVTVQGNGVNIVSNLDVFATVGAHAALIESGNVTVTNGQLVLSSVTSAAAPINTGWFVDAIEIIGQGSSSGGTTVPSVAGDTQSVAQSAITGAGLTVGAVTSAPSSSVASGSVISQSPVGGTSVTAGSAVSLVVSSGPGNVSVPYVLGDTQAAAATALTSAGLTVGTVTNASSSTVASGSVISENPSAGTSVTGGSAVSLTVSTGAASVSVPNVLGDTQGAASTLLANAGLTVGTVSYSSSYLVPSGSVISENPSAGTSVSGGSAVSLVVSTGSGGGGTSASNWTWEEGQTYAYAGGNYGNEGSPSTGNIPSARYQAVAWKDTSGNFWLFGGGGQAGRLNDLWEFNPGNLTWTWVSGLNYAPPTPSDGSIGYDGSNYGQQGVTSPNNVPGVRSGSLFWTDPSGNFWMFGGATVSETYVDRNDLWEYQPSIGQWTWVTGSSGYDAAGVYGNQNQAAYGNTPGARKSGATWTDAAGNLWLFGGDGFDGTGNHQTLNDLWKFSTSSRMWTWVSGSYIGNELANFGNEGQPSYSNVPGAAQASNSWIDSAGNLWLFGGYGPDPGPKATNGYGDYSALWEFTPSTGMWTWVSGPNAPDSAGVYGSQGVPGYGTMPGARNGSLSWTDGAGNFWLMGGYARDANDNWLNCNDLWEYQPGTGQWTWWAGSAYGNPNGNYGSQYSGSPGDAPGGRNQSATWIDSSGNLWLFGGVGYDSSGNYGLLNDLWKY